MERPIRTIRDAHALLATARLLTDAAHTIVGEWAAESSLDGDKAPSLPSPALHNAQRTALAAVGKITELVSEPPARIIEVACQYWESRCLAIAAERRVPDLIVEANGIADAESLALRTGIEVRKLKRVLRCLCSIGIFDEPRPDCFGNNGVSRALVANEPLRAYVMLFNLDLYSASDHLPRYLLDPNDGHSYAVENTPWQRAVGTAKPRWDWLEEFVTLEELGAHSSGYPGHPSEVERRRQAVVAVEKKINGTDSHALTNGNAVNGDAPHADAGPQPVKAPQADPKPSLPLYKRPELDVFGLAMVGGGRVYGEAHVHDFPWADLGEATVVDVGGGAGGFDIQLSKLYPKLNFVVQDRGPVLRQAETQIWPQNAPECLKSGRVKFQEHDFFKPNPHHGAEIYWLRYILHDWSDDYCVDILKAIKPAMASHSRILICDQVMHTTLADPEWSEPAPKPLPANYGYHTRYSHQRDLAMMGIINGIERTPQEWKVLTAKAGLTMTKIYDCRSQVSLVECKLE